MDPWLREPASSGKNEAKGDGAALNLKVGGKCVAYDDRDDKWFDSRVLKIDAANERAFVHYNGWKSRFDRWVEFSW